MAHTSTGRRVGFGGISGGVIVPEMYGYYGDITDASPNSLYRKYLEWFTKEYGTSREPLTFAQWIGWAKEKGIVMNADGPAKEVAAIPMTFKRKMAIALQIGLVVGIAILIIKSIPTKGSEATVR